MLVHRRHQQQRQQQQQIQRSMAAMSPARSEDGVTQMTMRTVDESYCCGVILILGGLVTSCQATLSRHMRTMMAPPSHAALFGRN